MFSKNAYTHNHRSLTQNIIKEAAVTREATGMVVTHLQMYITPLVVAWMWEVMETEEGPDEQEKPKVSR